MRNRFGAGEIYGESVARAERERLRALVSLDNRSTECPFTAVEPKGAKKCIKKGGVCSLRMYVEDDTGRVRLEGEPVATCPQRFLESGKIYSWVGRVLLGDDNPIVVTELPFLLKEQRREAGKDKPVGKIDRILVARDAGQLKWCALELQAVYFSGKAMGSELARFLEPSAHVPFPDKVRRPDFRSSGPKRLMPQLQTKVPTISRWGKKMAVVVDAAFWQSLGNMRETADISNSEIVWFVVSYEDTGGGRLELTTKEIHCTTLSSAVEGLTGGVPMSLEQFEGSIRARLPPL